MKVYETFTEEVTFRNVTYTVDGKHRDWNPLPGHTPPEGTLWEVTTKFDERHVIAAGDTKEEAMMKLVFYIGFYVGMKAGGGRA